MKYLKETVNVLEDYTDAVAIVSALLEVRDAINQLNKSIVATMNEKTIHYLADERPKDAS